MRKELGSFSQCFCQRQHEAVLLPQPDDLHVSDNYSQAFTKHLEYRSYSKTVLTKLKGPEIQPRLIDFITFSKQVD